MPIEIREISISLDLLDAVAGGADNPPAAEAAGTLGGEEKAALVRACVDAVLRALKDRNEA